MKTIYKYPISLTESTEHMIPQGGKVLCLQVQHSAPCLWILVDTDRAKELRKFTAIGTGNDASRVNSESYIGTFQMYDGMHVVHLFEDRSSFVAVSNSPETYHVVRFYSAGTLMAETTEKPIVEWEPLVAINMSLQVTERYGAKPFGFQFTTISKAPNTPDGKGGMIPGAHKKIADSPMYFINGQVETLDQVKAKNLESDRILIENMESNKYARVITMTNGYKCTRPFRAGSVNLDPDGNILEVAPEE